MSTREDSEMLELCESETDDLKTIEVVKPPESPQPILSDVVKSGKSTEKSSEINEDEDIQHLYISMGINLKDSNEASNVRLDTIYVHGVDEMSTKDVYNIFYPMKPMTLEWINDNCCNVVWPDNNSAAKALLELSQPEETHAMDTSVKLSSKDNNEGKDDSDKIVVVEEDDDDDVEEGSEDGELRSHKETKEVPWRTANHNGKQLKFRFSTWEDKKVRGAEKFSKYYKKYGNPNFGGLKGLISSSRKRKLRQGLPTDEFDYPDNEEEQQSFPENERLREMETAAEKPERRETLPKKPKMKMYADEEDRKSERQRTGRMVNRLGNITVNISVEDDAERDDYDELEVSSPQEFGLKSVWDRLQVEVPNTRYSSGSYKKSRRMSDNYNQKDLRKKLQTLRNNKKDHTSPLLLSKTTK